MKDKTFNLFKKYILSIAKTKYKDIRKRIYSLEYYLSKFFLVLNDVVKWKSLPLENTNLYHYKTIYNEFNKWSKDGIFKEAFYYFVSSNYFKVSKLKKNKNINLFIDTTKINNWKGSDGVFINSEYKKKNVTPLLIVCDENKLPLGITHLKINKKYKNGRKTCHHEVNEIQNVLNDIPLQIPKHIKINVIADKGFVSSKKYYLSNTEINLITPKKINQKTKTSTSFKKLLKNRYKIENLFSTIKSNHRIQTRYEKSMIHFYSFLYISFLKVYFSFIEKTNITLPVTSFITQKIKN